MSTISLVFGDDDEGVYSLEYITTGTHWRSKKNNRRKVYVLDPESHRNRLLKGYNMADLTHWNYFFLCVHETPKNSEDDCIYCQLLILDSNIELQEIETAIWEASGSYEERQKTVLQSYRSSRAIKPAKI